MKRRFALALIPGAALYSLYEIVVEKSEPLGFRYSMMGDCLNEVAARRLVTAWGGEVVA